MPAGRAASDRPCWSVVTPDSRATNNIPAALASAEGTIYRRGTTRLSTIFAPASSATPTISRRVGKEPSCLNCTTRLEKRYGERLQS